MVPSRDPDPAAPTIPASAAPRSDLDLARQQLEAIDRWHAARQDAAVAASRRAASREARMDLARRMEVVRAEHRAIVERTDAHLRSSVELLQRSAPRRAIVVHRNGWFAGRVSADLAVRSIVVVASLSNGAEAVASARSDRAITRVLRARGDASASPPVPSHPPDWLGEACDER